MPAGGGSRKVDRTAKKSSSVGGMVIDSVGEVEPVSSFASNYDAHEFKKCHGEFVSQLKMKHLYPLVGEIDRCLKKVGEGVEAVEDVWQKFMGATIQSQKEKYEAELKKEIKKLQRLREQIKSWITLADIKDKTMLLDTKKLIETQMEMFKEIEREMKIKTYSKVGLESVQKVDPVIKEAEDVNTWIANSIEQLGIQIDHVESEIELLMADKKRRGQVEEQNRLEKLQGDIERHRYHIDKLETLMKMLDDLGSDVNFNACRLKKFLGQVKKIKDDIDYYIEVNQEPDYEPNEYMYADIDGMEEFEQCLGNSAYLSTVGHDDTGISSNTSGANPSSPTMPSELVDAPCEGVILNNSDSVSKAHHQQANGVPTHDSTVKIIRLVPSEPSKRELQSSFKDVVTRSSVPYQNGSVKVPKGSNNSRSGGVHKSRTNAHGTAHRKKDTKAKKIHVNSSQSVCKSAKRTANSSEDSSHEPTTVLSKKKDVEKASLSSSANNKHSRQSCGTNAKPLTIHRDVNGNDCEPDDAKSTLVNANGTILTCQYFENQSLPYIDCSSERSQSGQGSPDLVIDDDFETFEGEVPANSTPTPPVEIDPPTVTETKDAHVPPLVAVAPLGQVQLQPEHLFQFQMLEESHRKLQATTSMPLYSCLEPPGQFLPRQPFISPAYYPQWPMKHMGTTDFYSKLTIDTLLFIFYYSGKSKAQYLAAKELKRQMWRFHKQYLVWFQRCDPPHVTTDEYEVGTYIYFDIEDWSQKKKENFVFEYKFLEDIEL